MVENPSFEIKRKLVAACPRVIQASRPEPGDIRAQYLGVKLPFPNLTIDEIYEYPEI
jgi:hypothetical protein